MFKRIFKIFEKEEPIQRQTTIVNSDYGDIHNEFKDNFTEYLNSEEEFRDNKLILKDLNKHEKSLREIHNEILNHNVLLSEHSFKVNKILEVLKINKIVVLNENEEKDLINKRTVHEFKNYLIKSLKKKLNKLFINNFFKND